MMADLQLTKKEIKRSTPCDSVPEYLTFLILKAGTNGVQGQSETGVTGNSLVPEDS